VAPMTDQERAFHDKQASVEAWEFALQILGPWVEAARAIGSDELTYAMDGALEATRFPDGVSVVREYFYLPSIHFPGASGGHHWLLLTPQTDNVRARIQWRSWF
jgi:hypothetical protein